MISFLLGIMLFLPLYNSLFSVSSLDETFYCLYIGVKTLDFQSKPLGQPI